MGAWGTAYNACDDYYNLKQNFSEPLFKSLEQSRQNADAGKWHDGSGQGYYRDEAVSGEFRAHLMWTFKTLENADVSLSEEDAETVRKSVALVREVAQVEGLNPEFKESMESEMDQVEKWLESFKPQGFLQDRIGAITEALNGQDGSEGLINKTL